MSTGQTVFTATDKPAFYCNNPIAAELRLSSRCLHMHGGLLEKQNQTPKSPIHIHVYNLTAMCVCTANQIMFRASWRT